MGPHPASHAPVEPGALLPTEQLRLIDTDGHLVACHELKMPGDDTLRALYRAMTIGRRCDLLATALTKQGQLAVYPSSRGQDACQAAAALALRDGDWLFPTYRDSVAAATRGVPFVDILRTFRGDVHCGFDSREHGVAPLCTPLATNTLHAVGFARAAQLKGEDTVALVLLGDGATSEGDTSEALNFAGAWRAPVVFVVQNNGYAISTPLHTQTAAPSLAHRGIGFGVRGRQVDGNDAAAMYAAIEDAVEHAAAGDGPTLIEAITYRIEPHTNADDQTRYRDAAEVEQWLAADPITRLQTYLHDRGLFDEDAEAALKADGDTLAAAIRADLTTSTAPHPDELFAHVYATPRPSLIAQRDVVRRELAAS